MTLTHNVRLTLAALAVLGLASAHPAQAQTTVLYGPTPSTDGEVVGPPNNNNNTFTDAGFGNNGDTNAGFFSGFGTVEPEFVIQLPTLGANQVFATANFFSNTFTKGGNINFSLNLYGLAARSSQAIQGSDFYVGSAPTGNGSDTLLQSAYVTTANSNLVASTDITSYLNAQYANGAGAGQFIFFRLTPNVQPNDQSFFSFTSGRFSGGRTPTTPPGGADPHIDYTTMTAPASAPEPSTWATFGVMGLALAGLSLRARKRSVKAACAA